MISLDFDWQTNEFMLYCRTTQLREKSMMAYEQSLKLFQRWCMDEMGIFTVDKVTENVIRRYIMELQERGKYTFYAIDKQKKTNYAVLAKKKGRCLWIRDDGNCRMVDTVDAETFWNRRILNGAVSAAAAFPSWYCMGRMGWFGKKGGSGNRRT